MRTIEVLGPGCDNCRRVEANAREAIAMAGVEAEVVDLRSLRPLDMDTVLESLAKTHRLVVVDDVMRSPTGSPEVAMAQRRHRQTGMKAEALPAVF